MGDNVDFKERSNIIVAALVVVVGLTAGFFGPDLLKSLQDSQLLESSQEQKPSIISSDHDFSEIEPIDVSSPEVQAEDSNWTYALQKFGDWQHSGLGGKPPLDILYNTNRTTYYIHTWTPTPATPGEWYNTTLSQNVSIPNDVANVTAVMEGRNGVFTLYEEQESYPACTTAEMALKVEGEGNSVQKQKYVARNSSTISIGINEMKGEDVTLIGGVTPDPKGCRTDAWLRVDSLRIETTG